MVKSNHKTQEESLEKQLWKAADKLRKNIGDRLKSFDLDFSIKYNLFYLE